MRWPRPALKLAIPLFSRQQAVYDLLKDSVRRKDSEDTAHDRISLSNLTCPIALATLASDFIPDEREPGSFYKLANAMLEGTEL